MSIKVKLVASIRGRDALHVAEQQPRQSFFYATAWLIQDRQEFFDKPVTSPTLRLSYQAAISITSYSASGREKTCQLIL